MKDNSEKVLQKKGTDQKMAKRTERQEEAFSLHPASCVQMKLKHIVQLMFSSVEEDLHYLRISFWLE